MNKTVQRIPNPAAKDITLEVGFDNSNPSSPALVRIGDDGAYVVTQFLEERAPGGYSFHLHIALNNTGAKPLRAPLRIIWAEKTYDFCHDYMYIGYDSGRTWQMLATLSVNGATELKIVVPPGRHLLCCHPKFDVGDYGALLNRFAGVPPFELINVAQSAEGRKIACLRCGNPGGRTTVITTRAHGYETAGAHCMSGWFQYAVAHPQDVAPVMEKLNLHFFPMINVDAVARGHCCLAPTGVNFGKELAIRAEDDAGAKGLTQFIFGLKPVFYLDMHNNTGPHICDSFRTSDPKIPAAFLARAADRSRDQKVWNANQTAFSVEGYMPVACRKRFGTLGMLTEFPWYTRRPQEMEAHGQEFFQALLPLLADWPV